MRAASAWAAVTVACLSAVACQNLEVVTASYGTLDEARRAGAVDRGWIPDGLPPGTTDLREAHDLDTNRRWGLFNFPISQAAELRRLIRDVEYPLQGVRCDVPGRIEWWPVLLRGRLDPESIKATGLGAHQSHSGDLVFLINWNQGRAYYWTLER